MGELQSSTLVTSLNMTTIHNNNDKTHCYNITDIHPDDRTDTAHVCSQRDDSCSRASSRGHANKF